MEGEDKEEGRDFGENISIYPHIPKDNEIPGSRTTGGPGDPIFIG